MPSPLDYEPQPPPDRPDPFALIARILVWLLLATIAAALGWFLYVHLTH